MQTPNLLKRLQRIAQRNKLIKQNHCPNCATKLRERMQGGAYCAECSWEEAHPVNKKKHITF